MPKKENNLTYEEVDGIVEQRMKSFLSLKDIPAGAPLARQLALNFGDIDFIEETGENFIWGVNTWGISRIGLNK